MTVITDPVNFLAQVLRTLLLGFGLSGDVTQFVMNMIGAGLLASLPMFLTIFLIWGERKLIARFQDRIGPNRVGPFGIFQTFADMVKIFTKEYITPVGVAWVPYNLAPILAVAAVLMLWAVIPFSATVVGVDINVGVLYLIAVGAIGTLGIIMAGWSSNNKYSLIAAFRTIAQLVSYEVPMVLVLLIPVMLSGSMSLNQIVLSQGVWYVFTAPTAALIFFITLLAEIGRAPFDLLEADSEIVAGFNVEYSGLKFGMFFVGDFLHAFTIALIFTSVFLGGWRGPWAEQYPILGFVYFIGKSFIVYFVGITLRASLPRFRIDQLLNFNWKYLTPLSLSLVVGTAVIDKLIANELTLIRVLALFIMNIILLLIADLFLKKSMSRRKRLIVAPEPRPVARP